MTMNVNPSTSPAPAAPQKQGRPLVRLGIGCLSLIVIGCIGIGGFALYESRQQEQNYQTGHQAYSQGDCAAAVEPLGKAARGEPGTRGNDVSVKAQAELQECEVLQANDALAAQGKPAEAVLGYHDMRIKYAASPLAASALTKGQELVTSSKPETLATTGLCESLDALVEQQFIAQPNDTLPPLLYACGQTYETAGEFSQALVLYDRFRSEYPDHSLAGDVQDSFVRATLAEAQALGAGELPAPQVVGGSGEAGGQVTVVIQNDSPERLSIVFSGPDVRVEELEACDQCQNFSDIGPSSCPNLGPSGNYILTPGTYDVVVKASSGDVAPFRGSWTLEGGQEYSSCFYLVTRSQ